MGNKRIGSPFSEFLDEEGLREEVETHAIKQVLDWQVQYGIAARACDGAADEDQSHPT